MSRIDFGTIRDLTLNKRFAANSSFRLSLLVSELIRLFRRAAQDVGGLPNKNWGEVLHCRLALQDPDACVRSERMAQRHAGDAELKHDG